jgi:hypothetical protein
MKKVAIAIDDWKLAIFARRLSAAGYPYEKGAGVTPDTLMLYVKTENVEALEHVVRAANAEAAQTGQQPAGTAPVDRTQRILTDGSPVPDDYSHTQDRGDGQQKGYIVLTEAERAKGFVRPVRRDYVHTPCGTRTVMGLALAETYARDPGFYSGTFCVGCGKHFPLDQFVWDGTTETVGS